MARYPTSEGARLQNEYGGSVTHTGLQFFMGVKCEKLSAFMKTQKEVIQKHLDEHKYLRHMESKEEALESFIADYGWLIRELYCTQICEIRNECVIASELSASGDLLSKRTKE